MRIQGKRISVQTATFDDRIKTRIHRFSEELLKYAEPGKPVKSVAEEKEWWRYEIVSGKQAIFTIYLADDTIIGFINVFGFNRERGDCESGIVIFPPENYGHGYGGEAYKLLLPYLKETYGLKSTYVFVALENTQAIRLFEKLGFGHQDTVTFDNQPWLRMTYDLENNHGCRADGLTP
ncbi:MAG: GNAT family N-acetyltransferase [bacterium]|nr:GNAT family N-acetyltransferase [bacterium]